MLPYRYSRRALLGQLGLAGAALSVGRIPAWALPSSGLAADEEVIPFTDMPADFVTRRPDGTATRLDLREIRSPITPNEAYFAVQHYNVPTLDAAAWRLQTSGLVDNPRTLALEDLKKRARTERTTFFECSGNRAQGMHGLLGNATWTGTSLKDLLHELKPQAEAREVVFWAADSGEETIRANKYTMHFARSMSLDEATAADAILAYEMNGQPLPVGHGFPVRLIVPGWYGVANVKWLTKIELIDTRFVNRFMGRDYVTIMGRQEDDHVEYTERSVSRQRVKSVIARVTRDPAGRVRVFGAAWSDGTPLKTVEVRIDGGAWQAAKLDAQANRFAWTFFTHEIDAVSPGAHTLISRATDRAGHTQPETLDLKKTYWEDNAQFTRKIMVPAH